MFMKKILFVFSLLVCAMMSFTSCEEKVQLTSLKGTTWRHDFDKYGYVLYSFLADGSASMAVIDSGEEDVNWLSLLYTCSSSGYVKTNVQYNGKTHKNGTFNIENGTLEMDGLKMDLVYHPGNEEKISTLAGTSWVRYGGKDEVALTTYYKYEVINFIDNKTAITYSLLSKVEGVHSVPQAMVLNRYEGYYKNFSHPYFIYRQDPSFNDDYQCVLFNNNQSLKYHCGKYDYDYHKLDDYFKPVNYWPYYNGKRD